MAGEENIKPAVPVAGFSPNIASDWRVKQSNRSRFDLLPYDAISRWRPGPAVGVVVFIVALSVGVAIVGGLLALRSENLSTAEAARSGKPLLAMLAAQVMMIIGALLAARARKGDDIISVLALKAPAGGLATYARALFAMLAVVATYTAFTYFVLRHEPSNDLGEMVGLFRGPWWPLALFVIGIGAPLSEELLFRGFLQTALVPTRLGYWGAATVTTTFWTTLHAGYSIPGLVEVFIIGLAFALMLRWTGSLRVPLVCHAIYNMGIALILIFVPKDWLGF